MVGHPSPHSDVKNPVIRRGSIGHLDVYEVSEGELETLEKGLIANHEFGFGMFLLSTAVTCMLALGTADFKWEIAKQVCILFMLVGLILGAYFMMLWQRTRKSAEEVVSEIKSRINNDTARTPEAPEFQPKQPEFKTAELLMNVENAIAKHQSALENKSEK